MFNLLYFTIGIKPILVHEKLKGEITFGLAVNTLTPLAVLMIGFGPWLEWSKEVVSYELGYQIISLSTIDVVAYAQIMEYFLNCCSI